MGPHEQQIAAELAYLARNTPPQPKPAKQGVIDAMLERARYYAGPAAAPLGGLAQFGASLLPGADMVDMQQPGANLMDYQGPMETLGDAGWLGLATLGMALPGRPGALRESVEDASKGIRAYHGSPHDFDRFSMDKIGTGEGAQAYGHGLYFAEKEAVARNYRDALAKSDITTPEGYADVLVRDFGPTEAIDRTMKTAPGAFRDAVIDRIRSQQTAPAGHMYEVNIAASPEDFLDWDKPLSEQSEKVRAVARDKGLSWGETKEAMSDRLVSMGLTRQEADEYAAANFYDSTGAMAYRELGGKSDASAALREAGIPGIRYLDAGSRPPVYGPYVQALIDEAGSKEKALEIARQRLVSGDARTQMRAQEAVDALSIPETHNYVVFDENLISILRKYGLGGLMVGGGAMGSLYGVPEEQRY